MCFKHSLNAYIMVKSSALALLKCGRVKNVGFSMSGICVMVKNVNFSVTEMSHSKNISFSITGLCPAKNVCFSMSRKCHLHPSVSACVSAFHSPKHQFQMINFYGFGMVGMVKPA
jgi:hypothetical protein